MSPAAQWARSQSSYSSCGDRSSIAWEAARTRGPASAGGGGPRHRARTACRMLRSVAHGAEHRLRVLEVRLEHREARSGEAADLAVAAPGRLEGRLHDGLLVALDLQVGEPAIEVGAGELLDGAKRPLLQGRGAVRNRHADLARDRLGLLERVAVIADELGGQLADRRRGGLGLGGTAAGDLEQVRLDVHGEPALVE